MQPSPFVPLVLQEACCMLCMEKFLVLLFKSTPHWWKGEKLSSICVTCFRSQEAEGRNNKNSHPEVCCYSHTKTFFFPSLWSAGSVLKTQTGKILAWTSVFLICWEKRKAIAVQPLLSVLMSTKDPAAYWVLLLYIMSALFGRRRC